MVGGIKTGTYSGKLAWLTWCQWTDSGCSFQCSTWTEAAVHSRCRPIPSYCSNPMFLFCCPGNRFKCGPSADRDVNSSGSWSRPHAQLNINDVTRKRLSRETSTAAAVESWSPRSGFKNSVWRQWVSWSWLKGGLRSTTIRSLKLG